MFKFFKPSAIAVAAAVLAACGGTSSPTATPSTSTAHGTLVYNPPFRIASVNAATLQAQLGATAPGAQLLQLTGNPTCGVDFYYIEVLDRRRSRREDRVLGCADGADGRGARLLGPAADRRVCARNRDQQGAEYCRHHEYIEHRRRV